MSRQEYRGRSTASGSHRNSGDHRGSSGHRNSSSHSSGHRDSNRRDSTSRSQRDNEYRRRVTTNRARNKRANPIAWAVGLAAAILVIGIGVTLFVILSPGSKTTSDLPGVPIQELPLSNELEPTPETYTVTLDTSAYGGAVVETPSIVLSKGTAVEHLPYAKSEGLRFTGWRTSPDGDETTVIDNTSLGLISNQADTTLYAHFEPKPTSVDYSVNGLPILMYHYFYDPNAGETSDDANDLNSTMFEEHLRYLRDNNYYFPTWDEINEYIRGNILLPQHSIVLTSDDGDESAYRLAVPLVEQYGARITLFVVVTDFNPSVIEQYNPNTVAFMSHSYDMHRAGGDGNGRLLTASPAEIEEDVRLGEQALGNRMAYCYPFGHCNAAAKQELAANGIQLGLAILNERAYPMMDPLEVPRIRISEGNSLETFIWQVS